MASYQDIDGRLSVIERKVDFIMKLAQATIQVGSPLDPKGVQNLVISFKDLYREVNHAGGQIIDVDSVPVAAEPEGSGVGEASEGGSDQPAQAEPQPVREAEGS